MIRQIANVVAGPSGPLTHTSYRRAAVALIITDALEILLIQRATRPGDPWSGQLALPGGHVEANESSVNAAIRETYEEIGLVIGAEQLLGPLHDVVSPALSPTHLVRPLVFHVDTLPPLRLQPTEVAATLTVALEDLLSETSRGSFHLTYMERQWELPCVDVGGQRLWGLTLRILDDLTTRLRDNKGSKLENNVRKMTF